MRYAALIALMFMLGCGGVEAPQPPPPPVPTPAPTPVPVPTPEPTPTPIPSCPAILSPGQNAALEEVDQVNVFGLILNRVMRDLSGCSGGRCIIDMTRQKWHAQVTAAIRMRGMCGTQHEPNTDEIAIGASVTSILEGYHIYSERPNRPGTGTIVFAPQANRPSWRIFGIDPDPNPTSPPTESCGLPEPPPVVKLKVRRHGGTPGAPKFDASGLVGPDADFCREVGYTDGRQNCTIRPDCSGPDCPFKDREVCERDIFGTPEWRSDGEIITLLNPWQIKIRGGTWVEVCGGGKCAGLDY